MEATGGNQRVLACLLHVLIRECRCFMLRSGQLARLLPFPLGTARSFSAAACLRHFPPQLNTRDDDEVFLTQQYFVITSD